MTTTSAPRVAWALACAAALLLAPALVAQRPAHGRLFPPEDLGILEGPDRDEWQQPDGIMDALHIAEGSRVADLGAGGGWFTVRLARRVGPNGIVYAEDIQKEMVDSIARRVRNQGLTNVRTILGGPTDPLLPSGLNAVLMVDTYPQLHEPVALLRTIGRALAPNGLFGIVDFKKDGRGGPGPPVDERIDPEIVRHDAEQAGFEVRSYETFLRYQYLLVLARK